MQLLINLAMWSYVAWFTTCNLTDIEWASILPAMAEVCPLADVCGRIPVVDNNLSTVEMDKCCRGCSCSSDCHKQGNCCFSHQNVDQASLRACLSPSLNQESGMMATFYFTVHPPTDGCTIQDDGTNTASATCRSDIDVSPWGNFFPVYSTSLERNFKNELCAFCHGANKSDIKHWTSHVTFTGDSEMLFDSALTTFYETYNTTDPTIIFNPPNPESKSFDKRCFRITGECNQQYMYDDFFIPSALQQDPVAIKDACTQGPVALYLDNITHAYKNVYCAVCNSKARVVSDGMVCSFKEGLRFFESQITTLIDSSFVHAIKSKPKDNGEFGSCFRPPENANDSRCVQPFCPTLQTRFPDGKCGFPSTDLTTGCVGITVNLSTPHRINKSDIFDLSSGKRLSIFEKAKPWPKLWEFSSIAWLNETNGTEFSVMLTARGRINLQRLIMDIPKRMTKPWTLLDRFDLTQVFQNKHHWYYNAVPVYLNRYSQSRSCFQITKLAYCQQIEFGPDEYERTGLELRLLHHDVFLYGSKGFMLMMSTNGTRNVRVCVEDSGYVKVDSGNGAIETACGVHHVTMVLMALAYKFV